MELLHGYRCSCGKVHDAGFDRMIVGKGAVETIAGEVGRYGGKRVFLLADENTMAAGGKRVEAVLKGTGIPFSEYVFPTGIEPDETALGGAVMRYDRSCDLLIAVGSGVVNDIGKLLAATAGIPYFIVGTAPSMDGYASATSSVVRDGLKVSIGHRCADVLIGDTDILSSAPDDMLVAGLGDMIAKYVSIAEWRIANLVLGEYYCEKIAGAVREALGVCVSNAKGLLAREPGAVEAVYKGLVLSGAAMNYAGLSRPASGVEHYFSHVWDMRGLAFGTPTAFHGTQCAVGTLCAARVYDRLLTVTPDREKARGAVAAFSRDDWFARLRAFLGRAADPMIEAEERDGKYDPARHAARLEILISRWGEIQAIIRDEIPRAQVIRDLLRTVGAPTTPEEIGQKREELPTTFSATRDVRDKYGLSRLVWDLGLCDLADAILLGEE